MRAATYHQGSERNHQKLLVCQIPIGRGRRRRPHGGQQPLRVVLPSPSSRAPFLTRTPAYLHRPTPAHRSTPVPTPARLPPLPPTHTHHNTSLPPTPLPPHRPGALPHRHRRALPRGHRLHLPHPHPPTRPHCATNLTDPPLCPKSSHPLQKPTFPNQLQLCPRAGELEISQIPKPSKIHLPHQLPSFVFQRLPSGRRFGLSRWVGGWVGMGEEWQWPRVD
jgi:hypothetical protein